jgi:hypothetical protein
MKRATAALDIYYGGGIVEILFIFITATPTR